MGPLFCPNKNDLIWSSIPTIDYPSLKFGNTVETIEKESVWMLVDGVANLCNYIINCQNQGDPVDTLVFLDRSARPGAYLFRLVWNELSQTHKIPTSVKRPRIKFMNLGKDGFNLRYNEVFSENYENSTHISLLHSLFAQLYPREDFNDKKVLIVDESFESGDTAKLAMKLISEVFRASVSGLALFRNFPSWYDHDGSKGVTNYDHEFTQSQWNFFHAIDGKLLIFFKKLFSIRSIADKNATIVEFFRECLATDQQWNALKMVDTYSDRFQMSADEINTLRNFIKATDFFYTHENILALGNFIKSVGTLLSKRMTDKMSRLESLRVRKTLKEIAKQSAKHITLGPV